MINNTNIVVRLIKESHMHGCNLFFLFFFHVLKVHTFDSIVSLKLSCMQESLLNSITTLN